MDLELDGLSGASSVGVGAEGGINQVTLLRLNIHDIHVGIIFSSSTLDFWNSDGNLGHSGHKMWDQLTVFDSTISRAIGGIGGYIGCSKSRTPKKPIAQFSAKVARHYFGK